MLVRLEKDGCVTSCLISQETRCSRNSCRRSAHCRKHDAHGRNFHKKGISLIILHDILLHRCEKTREVRRFTTYTNTSWLDFSSFHQYYYMDLCPNESTSAGREEEPKYIIKKKETIFLQICLMCIVWFAFIIGVVKAIELIYGMVSRLELLEGRNKLARWNLAILQKLFPE